jgi:hypothetical protein
LLDRVDTRHISIEDLSALSEWLRGEPDVPRDRWFKRFRGMIVCGEGELIKTFLRNDQAPTGKELK